MEITDLQKDALGEIFNIGVGRAADSLSQIVGEEVALSTPQVRFVPPEEVVQVLQGTRQEALSTVTQTFSGPFKARAMMVFPEHNALTIVSHMFAEDITPEELSEYEQEALCEFGNIILNAVISAFSDIFALNFEGSLPTHQFTSPSPGFFNEDSEAPSVLVLQVDLSIRQERIEGHLFFLLGVSSLKTLIECINRYLADEGVL